ncbi:tRNA pseudouridine synthase B [Sodalis-like endosymbiont of Proechinophthirus fluctus]|uniref:tRNA pseudouridine(55) synthase TruB n=1 Tax=Sodalis-like endosymbiont of Proechinophthirus fluctus TaxID=1462730 RepID=UPI0007A811D9|nr:tRNA pseudouridine(55) synthase TruB [Sodalis-like endosymbiont of Proechinophthirus fluctus]KYP97661.1 tRNA pseudouridine synthase B [Sodalis-like endosymbiont of Proechinophthirus fluctus]
MSRPSRRGRDIDGIVLLDKPLGLSSNDLLQKVKRLFLANRAGHTGALDPLATGMLPVCLGEATKFSQHLLEADKRYRVTARFGERTDTSDAEGQTVSVRPVSLDQARLEAALNYFRGESSQVPSMFSALKHQGRPLYEYARKGVTVERKARSIHVYDLQLHHWDLTEVELEIHCSKGTYIRTIIDDLGESLGCGAHVTALRRLAVSCYPTERMVTLAELQAIATARPEAPETLAQLDALLLPIDSAVADMPVVNLSSDIATRVWLGQTIAVTAQLQAGLVRLTEGDDGSFIGIGEIAVPGWLTPRRLIAEPRA